MSIVDVRSRTGRFPVFSLNGYILCITKYMTCLAFDLFKVDRLSNLCFYEIRRKQLKSSKKKALNSSCVETIGGGDGRGSCFL
jgi:hypothetical protein